LRSHFEALANICKLSVKFWIQILSFQNCFVLFQIVLFARRFYHFTQKFAESHRMRHKIYEFSFTEI
jgi:hypothetical protein